MLYIKEIVAGYLQKHPIRLRIIKKWLRDLILGANILETKSIIVFRIIQNLDMVGQNGEPA